MSGERLRLRPRGLVSGVMVAGLARAPESRYKCQRGIASIEHNSSSTGMGSPHRLQQEGIVPAILPAFLWCGISYLTN